MFSETAMFLNKYFIFRYHSKPRGGHGIHSPFVYDLYTNCIDTKRKEAIFAKIEETRASLLKNNTILPKTNFGAGSKGSNSKSVTIKGIVKRASIPKYEGELLFKLANYLNPRTIIELGSSTGISTMYLASGCRNAKVISIEGDINLINLAAQNVNKLGLSNVTLINGDFDALIPSIINSVENVDLVFIDGNHSEEATIKYFNLFSAKVNTETLIIFDDIRWSKGMKNAWKTICTDIRVSISIDLFNCGLVFFRKGIVKQHFNLRYGPF